MKYIDEYRDSKVVRYLAREIADSVSRSWNIMEICGGQTHSVMKYNLMEFLPSEISLIHGPGCPVCVTPLEKIDRAIRLAENPENILATYGDMIRVPGSRKDLYSARAEGADIRIVYSPLDAVRIAEDNPSRKVIFFAIGFETTAPANALSVVRAEQLKLSNYFLISSHVLVPPAMELILSMPECRVNGFLAAGHVCTVMGYHQYEALADKYDVPITVTGFEPVDILKGIKANIRQLENGIATVENEYRRSVKREGNKKAQELLSAVFKGCDQMWRGIGVIPGSGLRLSERYSAMDAEIVFDLEDIKAEESELCIAGQILQGLKKPVECLAFGKECKPESPLGAPMVSQEGACAAYYRYNTKI